MESNLQSKTVVKILAIKELGYFFQIVILSSVIVPCNFDMNV